MEMRKPRLPVLILSLLPVLGAVVLSLTHPSLSSPVRPLAHVVPSDDDGFTQGAAAPAIARKYTVQNLRGHDSPWQGRLRWLRFQYPYGRIPPKILQAEEAKFKRNHP